MRTLYVIGDSFSTPFNYGGKFREDYNKWKGYVPKYWGELVSEQMGLNLVTFGSVGDNEDMIDKVIDLMDQIKPDDIICIGWTSTLRFRLTKDNEWWCVFPGILPDTELISRKTLEELVVNRENTLYKDALYNRIKLINKAFSNNLIIHWSWLYENEFKFDTIYSETNGYVNDHHWSEKGNAEFASWLIGKIKENENVILI
jgi:hypothetical protein